MSDSHTQAGLRKSYAQHVGRIKLEQRPQIFPEGEALNVWLHEELIAAIDIGEGELKQLAKNRAQVALGLMIKVNLNLNERINEGDLRQYKPVKRAFLSMLN